MKITFEGESLHDLIREAKSFLTLAGTPSEEAVSTKKEKTKASADKSHAAATPQSKESQDSGATTTAGSGHDLKAVSDAVAQLVSKVGRAKTIEFFKTFKVARAGELKPEQYADFLSKAKDLINA